jgi:hypothetical protein
VLDALLDASLDIFLKNSPTGEWAKLTSLGSIHEFSPAELALTGSASTGERLVPPFATCHIIRNDGVGGSNPSCGTNKTKCLAGDRVASEILG